MIINDISMEVKAKCSELGVHQVELAKKIGTSGSYLSRIINQKGNIMNRFFIKMLDALGYDIQLVYVQKDKNLIRDD